MNITDRRRATVAAVFTMLALPAMWALDRGSSAAPTVGAAGVAAPAANATPVTTAYHPDIPAFLDGPKAPVAPAVIDIAVAPEPDARQADGTASYQRYAFAGAGSPPCTTLLAPSGALVTVLDVDNGQSITCTNTYGPTIPAGVAIVLHTDAFATLASLSESPVPVRISW